jgi:hypothetical protein
VLTSRPTAATVKLENYCLPEFSMKWNITSTLHLFAKHPSDYRKLHVVLIDRQSPWFPHRKGIKPQPEKIQGILKMQHSQTKKKCSDL